ncbi:MAG: glycerate kinase [Phycisphaerae bacterium]|nr:glycerate kinase [Phycisphaerae bacterium]
MRILIAPDKFKGTLTQRQACAAIRRGAENAAREAGIRVEFDEGPVADGGEGTLEVVTSAQRAEFHRRRVLGPDGERRVDAQSCSWTGEGGERYCLIESARCIGLALVDQPDPENATSFGLGELIRSETADDHTVIVGLGGSATTDGGVGMAQGCGVEFGTDPSITREKPAKREHEPDGSCESHPARHWKEHVLRGRDLLSIRSIVRVPSLRAPSSSARRLIALCDVQNPLLGPRGAARMFGPQKGATPEQVERLEAGLENLVRVCRECNIPCDPDQLGAGAAGGLGFGLATFLGAKLVPGAPYILDLLNFDERCKQADLVITGEGRMDMQTAEGKACAEVAKRAERAAKPCIAVVGTTDGEPADLQHALEGHAIRFHSIRRVSDSALTPIQGKEVHADRLADAARVALLAFLGA